MESVLLSTEDCAARKGVTRQAICAAIARGALPAMRIGKTYIVREADCDAWVPAMTQAEKGRRNAKPRRKPGRPRKSPAVSEG